jgi:hypothetical protein
VSVKRNVKVVFASSDAAKLCKIRVRPGSEDLISVSPSTPSEAETLLTITGKDPAEKTGRQEACIEVVTKDSMAQVLQVLSVDVLPEYVVPVRISFVYDGTYPEEANPTRPAIGAEAIPAIIDRLNAAFRPAMIHFVNHPHSGPKAVSYDHIRDGNVNNNPGDNNEFDAVGDLSAMQPEVVHIAIVRQIDPAMQIKGWVKFGIPNVAFVGEANCGPLPILHHVCAHEVGHVLQLSTRRALPWHAGMEADRHDVRMVPRRYRVWPLMFPAVRDGMPIERQSWMRREDWFRANGEVLPYRTP